MSEEQAVGRHEPSEDRSKRPEFVEFRDRIKRLVDSLVALRSNVSAGTDAERADVKLESDAVIIQFFLAQLSWEVTSEVVSRFQTSFAGLAPVFLHSETKSSFRLEKSCEKEGGFGQLYRKDNTVLTFQREWLNDAAYSVKIRTSLNDFNVHFEVFVTDVAKILFPAVKPPRKDVANLEAWHKEFGRSFEKLGCRVLRESTLAWQDLAGLDELRKRLERGVFLPLAREQLYQKVALGVLPHPTNVLPRGVLLHGPPGCGKTWSMKVIAAEAGLPIVVLPCEAVLSKWYGESENRLASVFGLCREAGRMILLVDEIDALARRRSEAHEATARMVSILLSELDGLAESTRILLVGSANNLESIDPAVLDRFDLKIRFDPPTRDQLRAAMAYYAKQLSQDDVEELLEHLDGWNFRRVARFAEEVVREYVSKLDLSLLEANTPPLPRKEDYLAALARGTGY